MPKARTLVRLDVHAAKVVAVNLDSETGELCFQRLGGKCDLAVNLCCSLPGPVRATYEAGPTGYGLARGLYAAGVECLVAAPGKIPRGGSDRIKTDRRDAEHLVRLLLAGKLSPVRVPGPPEEAMRDLVRAREDLRMDLMRARHRLSKSLLRYEIRFEGPGNNWTTHHLAWLSKLEFDDPAARATFEDYHGGVEVLLHRRDELERTIESLISGSPWAGREIKRRQEGKLPTVIAVAWSAQKRLHRTYSRTCRVLLGSHPSRMTLAPH